uniref:Uncharacterized protein n=1 Tax=Opuntia streptacantha TaxID=393608 RepID=A0A7C9DFH3_OPUST
MTEQRAPFARGCDGVRASGSKHGPVRLGRAAVSALSGGSCAGLCGWICPFGWWLSRVYPSSVRVSWTVGVLPQKTSRPCNYSDVLPGTAVPFFIFIFFLSLSTLFTVALLTACQYYF